MSPFLRKWCLLLVLNLIKELKVKKKDQENLSLISSVMLKKLRHRHKNGYLTKKQTCMPSYNFLIIGDPNYVHGLCETYNLQNIVQYPTCYKNPSKTICTAPILTNFSKSFQHIQTIETSLSRIHKLTINCFENTAH